MELPFYPEYIRNLTTCILSKNFNDPLKYFCLPWFLLVCKNSHLGRQYICSLSNNHIHWKLRKMNEYSWHLLSPTTMPSTAKLGRLGAVFECRLSLAFSPLWGPAGLATAPDIITSKRCSMVSRARHSTVEHWDSLIGRASGIP